MRTIKFRAKRVDNGEWVYGDLNQHPIHYPCQIIENGVIHYSVDPETVGQYTGCKDINGTEIYEGDFMKHTRRDVQFVVMWYRLKNGYWVINITHSTPEKSYFECLKWAVKNCVVTGNANDVKL